MRRAILVLGILCGACGGSKATAPTPSVPTTTSVTVSAGADWLFLGGWIQVTAQEQLSNGTTRPATPSWSSDTVGVATVDGTGKVTGQHPGEATIIADANGSRGSLKLRVVPTFQGGWSGLFRVTSCDGSEDFARAGVCEAFPNGYLLRGSLTLTQTREKVTGSIFFDATLAGQFDPIAMDGRLHFVANGPVGNGFTYQTDWNVTSDPVNRMDGTMRLTALVEGFRGRVIVTTALQDMTRTSAIQVPSGVQLRVRR